MAIVFNVYIYLYSTDYVKLELVGTEYIYTGVVLLFGIFFGLSKAFFNKESYYWERTRKMLKNEKVLKLMKKEYPVKGKKKWKFAWYEPGCHRVVKELYQNDIDPVILEDLSRDKELKLTMKKLEIEPSLLQVEFWKDLNPKKSKEIQD